MEELLKCTNCTNWSNKPYECIYCGYLYCSSCLESSYCIMCKKPSLFKLSKLAALITRVYNNVCIYCNNSISTNYLDFKKHKYKCSQYKYKCSMIDCDFIGNQSEIISHIQVSHESDMLNAFDSRYIKSQTSKLSKNYNIKKKENEINKNKESKKSLDGSEQTNKCLIY